MAAPIAFSSVEAALAKPLMTSFVFRETLMTHLLLYGNAYVQIIRNGKGDVPLMTNRMSVDRDDKG